MTGDVVSRVLGELLGAGVPSELDDGTTLVELGVDSLRLVEVVILLEQVADVFIPDEDLDAANFVTVGSLRALIARLDRSLRG